MNNGNSVQPTGTGIAQHSKMKSGIGRGIGGGSLGAGIAPASQLYSNTMKDASSNNQIPQSSSNQNLNMYNNQGVEEMPPMSFAAQAKRKYFFENYD